MAERVRDGLAVLALTGAVLLSTAAALDTTAGLLYRPEITIPEVPDATMVAVCCSRATGKVEALLQTGAVSMEVADTLRVLTAVEPVPEPEPEPEPAPEPEQPWYLSDSIPLSYTVQEALYQACCIHGVPYGLALGVIETESDFHTDVVSSSGAYGLMQIMDRWYHSRWMTPEENVQKGVEILGYHYSRYGNWPAALTAYNAGHDTGGRSYANRVLQNAQHWGYWG